MGGSSIPFFFVVELIDYNYKLRILEPIVTTLITETFSLHRTLLLGSLNVCILKVFAYQPKLFI